MSVDELAVMDGGKCLLQIRGVRPFLVNNFMSCHRFNLIRCHKSAHFPVMLSIAYTIVQSYLFASSQDSIFHATVGNCLTIPDMADHIHLRNCA